MILPGMPFPSPVDERRPSWPVLPTAPFSSPLVQRGPAVSDVSLRRLYEGRGAKGSRPPSFGLLYPTRPEVRVERGSVRTDDPDPALRDRWSEAEARDTCALVRRLLVDECRELPTGQRVPRLMWQELVLNIGCVRREGKHPPRLVAMPGVHGQRLPAQEAIPLVIGLDRTTGRLLLRRLDDGPELAPEVLSSRVGEEMLRVETPGSRPCVAWVVRAGPLIPALRSIREELLGAAK